MTIIYRSNDCQGDVRINGEHTKFFWFPRDEIPRLELISPPIIPVIEKFISRISNRTTEATPS